jgi:hypothetical protein
LCHRRLLHSVLTARILARSLPHSHLRRMRRRVWRKWRRRGLGRQRRDVYPLWREGRGARCAGERAGYSLSRCRRNGRCGLTRLNTWYSIRHSAWHLQLAAWHIGQRCVAVAAC